MSEEAEREARIERIARGVRVVREGHGANCSSIGSVVDTLFATAVVGGALYAAVAAALARGEARVVPPPRETREPREDDAPESDPR